MKYELHQGDCLQVMATLPDASFDAVICDPPYGTTACKWDSVIPLEPMWEQLKRLIKPKGAIVLFGSQPFTSALIMSNPKMFKYEWIWNKKKVTGFLDAKKRPLKQHENIILFCAGQSTYHPELHQNKLKRDYRGTLKKPSTANYGKQHDYVSMLDPEIAYPRSIIEQTAVTGNSHDKVNHPTQKPVALMEYLIKTYTNKGEKILDFTFGSGTTGVAAMNTNRNFVGIERDENYFKIAQKRIEEAANPAQMQLVA